jgi:drug/metabolite transporter (DMT)-like permease
MNIGNRPVGFAAALVLAAACWGAATVMTKGTLAEVPPITLLVVQLAASVMFLWGLLTAQKVRVPRSVQSLRLGSIGLLNPGLAYTFGLLGLTRTTASMSTLIWALEPILILGLAWAILRERLARPLLLLASLAIIGVFLVIGVDTGTNSAASFSGNLLILAGVGCCALYTVTTRRVGLDTHPLALVLLQQVFALAWALVIWPVELWGLGLARLAAIGPGAWGWAIVSGIFYYALAFWFYIVGLRKAPASLAGLFLNLIPVFGIGGAYLFLGERLSAVQWLGAGLIVAAVSGLVYLNRALAPLEEPAVSTPPPV